MEFIEITKDNIDFGMEIDKKIFPEESAYNEYLDIINRNQEYQKNFVVKENDEIIGITGYYSNEPIEETNSLWLCWFGIVPEKRRQGYGKKLLNETINKVKELSTKYPIKYLRLYTSTEENPESLFLYDQVMDTKESYTNENDYTYRNTCVIYTKSLTDESVELWNNRFLNINKMKEQENEESK